MINRQKFGSDLQQKNGQTPPEDNPGQTWRNMNKTRFEYKEHTDKID